MSPALTAALLAAGVALFARSAYLRLAPLALFRRERRTDRLAERAAALLRFGFGQARLLDRGERTAGWLHVVVFAAFLVLLARTITLFGMGFSAGFHLPLLAPDAPFGRVYGFAKELVLVAAAVAALGFLWRRLVSHPKRLRLSAEGNVILLLILALMVTDAAFEGASRLAAPFDPLAPAASAAAFVLRAAGLSPGAVAAVGLAGFWGHLAVVLLFLNLLPLGKHFHVLTALPDVFFRRLPPESALAWLDLEAEDARFGTARLTDLSWKEGLDVYSCTECGRCDTRCPTVATGKPLSHRDVNLSLRAHARAETPALLAALRAPDAAARAKALEPLPPLSDVVKPDTFWACTTCGWCEQACPVFIENVPRLVDLRRQKALVDAEVPDEAARVFRALETQGNPWGIGSNRRADWAAGLDVPRAADGGEFEWLFFVGCAGAFDERQQRVSRAIVRILKAAGVSFAILGEEETCTGDAARRLGNEYLFQTLARANVERFAAYGVKKILVQCPHCLNALAKEYPQAGGHYEVVHHAELVARLVAEGRLPSPEAGVVAAGGPVTFHDPCYLARWNGVVDAPRAALAAAGVDSLREMARSGRDGFCCGAGGGRFWLEEKLGTRINRVRADEACATLGGPGTIATACPFCLTMLKDGVADAGREADVKVLDVAELIAERLGP